MSTVKTSVELFFQEGNSDKLYHARIIEISAGKHDVLLSARTQSRQRASDCSTALRKWIAVSPTTKLSTFREE